MRFDRRINVPSISIEHSECPGQSLVPGQGNAYSWSMFAPHRMHHHGDSRPRLAVIGAGPIGLDVAVRAVGAGFETKVFEAGSVADHLRRWGHVRLFTPFSMNHSESGRTAIRESFPDHPFPEDHAFVTGYEYVEAYLGPLANTRKLQELVHTGHRVVSVGRHGLLKHEAVGVGDRSQSPFMILVERDGGGEQTHEADFVIDASGVYGCPNYLGPGGMPAVGERSARAAIRYGLVDVDGAERDDFAGKRTVLIGAGYSAATTAVSLRSLVEGDAETSFVWLTRSIRDKPVRAIPNDSLPERRKLSDEANQICCDDHTRMRHIPGAWIDRIDRRGDGKLNVCVVGSDGRREEIEANRVVANVGFSPDRSIYEQLQVHECYATGAPMKLAASLMESVTMDCLDRPKTDADLLANPEPNFFIIGNKSYGSDPTFLLQNGLAQSEQVINLMTQALR